MEDTLALNDKQSLPKSFNNNALNSFPIKCKKYTLIVIDIFYSTDLSKC